MLRPYRMMWPCTFLVGMSIVASASNGCGARTSLGTNLTCASEDIVPADDAAIVVQPTAFVPRSSMVTDISSSTRLVLISSSLDACNDFKTLTFNANNRAPADSRFLDISFARAADDASYEGAYTVPSSAASGERSALAVVLKFCAGDPFVSGAFSWFFVSDAGPAATGTLDVADYSEGQYASGTYDLQFPEGGHVQGSFDAGWCQ